MWKVTLEFNIDPNDYEHWDSLADAVYDEIADLMRSDIMAGCLVEEITNV
jgi:hypothetical protein